MLLALPSAVRAAKNVKPDPDGLPPQDVKDLHYGDVLFYFFQDDYFDSITRLLAARQLDRIPHTQGEAELLLGGLYLSLGEHVEAGKIFEALLNQNTSEAVRNKAWFYLGKVWYQRGYWAESERALRQVSDKIDPRISAERYMLLAQLMMRQERYDDAIAALEQLARRSGLDRLRAIQLRRGPGAHGTGSPRPCRISTGWGASRRAARSCCRSRTRPTWPWGSRCCRRSAPPKPSPSWSASVSRAPSRARRCSASAGRTPGRVNSSARWCPWLTLRKRSLLDSAVQESFLTVPYAYSQLSATGQAAEYYNSAIESFDAEIKLIDDSIEADPQRTFARPPAG